MESDEREIRTLHAIWIEAVNAADLPRLLSLAAEDLVLLSPGQSPCGREGFASTFLAAHQSMHVRCVSELEEVVVVGEMAYARARDTLSVTPRGGGETARFAGDRLTVYRRHGDGRWLLARDAHTLVAVT